MKYLKRINELFDTSHLEYKLVSKSENYYTYEFDIEDREIICEFKNCDKGIWERVYSVNGRFNVLINNPFKVVSTITEITMDFIRKENPEAIVIIHIPIDGEIIKGREKNKRARINYKFLSKSLPSEYQLYYFNDGNKTYCAIHKDSFDTALFKKYKNLYF